VKLLNVTTLLLACPAEMTYRASQKKNNLTARELVPLFLSNPLELFE